MLALFLIVVGARFWLIERYALPMPFWDQWDAEGLGLLQPWLEGTLRFQAFFAPHNEHRIVLTRLLALGLFAANGQWDGWVEMAANAVFWGVAAVGIGGVATSSFHGQFQRTILLAVAVYFVLPFGWENTLCGFQSQNYFLILFSLLGIWGLVIPRLGSAGWWAGLAGVALANLSMATGFLAAAAVLSLLGLRWTRERRRPNRGEWVTGLLCFITIWVGWLTRVEVAAHAPLRAESLAAWAEAICRFLAWPCCEHPALAGLALMPPALLVIRYLQPTHPGSRPARDDAAPRAELLLAVSGWAVLQTGALAYGRGGHGVPPACRYMDLLGILPLVSFFAWLALLAGTQRTLWRRITLGGMILWLVPLLLGLQAETKRDFDGWLPGYRRQLQAGEQRVREYLATHDGSRFLAAGAADELPYPLPGRLAAMLDNATLQRILPADIRLPLTLHPTNIAGATAFVPGGYDPVCGLPPGGQDWGSYTEKGHSHAGDFQARFSSPAKLPYLRFSFAGDLGEPGLKFSLRGASGQRQVSWRPNRPARGRWRREDLPSPGQEVLLEAGDSSASGWFAFSAPVEVGWWSRWTGFLLRRSNGFLLAGMLLLGGVEFIPRLARLPKTSRHDPAPDQQPAARPLTLLSVVIPARDEENCLAQTVEGLHAELCRAAVPHEMIVVDDGSGDRTGAILSDLSTRLPGLRGLSNPGPHGFGRAINYGLNQMRGDAVVIMMADGSDAPADAVRYWQILQEGYDCVFGSRFVRGSRVVGYPGFKLAINRLANGFIRLLFNVACNDVTNAFKAYRREVIEGCRPLIAPHFNLTVEIPLKAMVRGYRWKVIPITWQNRRGGATKFKLKEMGSRYLFVCGYVWLEKHLSRGDYRRG